MSLFNPTISDLTCCLNKVKAEVAAIAPLGDYSEAVDTLLASDTKQEIATNSVDGQAIAPASVASTGPISGTTGTFSGNVGVKTVTPDRDFQVIGIIEAADTGGAARKSIAMYVAGTYTVLQAYDLAGGAMQLSIQPLGGPTLIGGTTNTGEVLQVYGNLKVSGVIKIPQTTFAGLVSAATAGNGARGYITDSFLSFSGTNIGLGTSGGGGNHCPVVVVNGAWVVG